MAHEKAELRTKDLAASLRVAGRRRLLKRLRGPRVSMLSITQLGSMGESGDGSI